MGDEQLGRFGHHPMSAIDFCVEVECCENDAYGLRAGGDRAALLLRINRAMSFRVGGDVGCVNAKHALRQLEEAVKGATERDYLAGIIAQRSGLVIAA